MRCSALNIAQHCLPSDMAGLSIAKDWINAGADGQC
jgi:hypothetical protein